MGGAIPHERAERDVQRTSKVSHECAAGASPDEHTFSRSHELFGCPDEVVFFYAKVQLYEGERLYVTGDANCLGHWNPANGLELRRSATDPCRWLPATTLPGLAKLSWTQYKYVIVGRSDMYWEYGPNRRVHVDARCGYPDFGLDRRGPELSLSVDEVGSLRDMLHWEVHGQAKCTEMEELLQAQCNLEETQGRLRDRLHISAPATTSLADLLQIQQRPLQNMFQKEVSKLSNRLDIFEAQVKAGFEGLMEGLQTLQHGSCESLKANKELPKTQGLRSLFGGGLVCHGASMSPSGDVSSATVVAENFDAATASEIQRLAKRFGLPCHRTSVEVGMQSICQALDDYLPEWMILIAHGDRQGCAVLQGQGTALTHCMKWNQMAREVEDHLNHCSGKSKLRFVVVVACKGDEFAKLLPDLGLDAVGWECDVWADEGRTFVISLLGAFCGAPSGGCPAAFSPALRELHSASDGGPQLHLGKVALLCYCCGSAHTEIRSIILQQDENIYTCPHSDWQEAARQARLRGMRMLILCGTQQDVAGGLSLPHSSEVDLTKMDVIVLIFPCTQEIVTKLRNSGAQLMLLFPPTQPGSSKEVAHAVRFLAEAYAWEVRDPTSASMREFFTEALEEMPDELLQVKPELA